MGRFATVFLWLMVFYSNSTAVHSAESVKIGAIFAKTGKMAFGNIEALNAVRYAVEKLNNQGGVLNKKLELVEFDNHGTAIGSKIAAGKAVESGVVIVFGANWSSHSLAMAPVLQTAKIPMITPISTNPEVTRVGNYIFRICFTDPFQGIVLSQFAINDLKVKSAAVLTNVDDKYSEGLTRFFIENFKYNGGQILFVENYLENTSDFSSFINKIKQFRPDVVFHPGHTKMSAFVLKQARKQDVDIPFLGGDGWNDSMYKIAGSSIEGNYYSNHWHQDHKGMRSIQFVKEYKEKNWVPHPVSALAEDCVFLFADAVKRSKSFEPALIRDAIAETKYFQGITGSISFDVNGDPIKSAVVLKFEDGRSVFVKSVDPVTEN